MDVVSWWHELAMWGAPSSPQRRPWKPQWVWRKMLCILNYRTTEMTILYRVFIFLLHAKKNFIVTKRHLMCMCLCAFCSGNACLSSLVCHQVDDLRFSLGFRNGFEIGMLFSCLVVSSFNPKSWHVGLVPNLIFSSCLVSQMLESWFQLWLKWYPHGWKLNFFPFLYKY